MPASPPPITTTSVANTGVPVRSLVLPSAAGSTRSRPMANSIRALAFELAMVPASSPAPTTAPKMSASQDPA